MSQVLVNMRFGHTFGGDNEYKVITSAEMTERGHQADHRFGICFAIEETKNGCLFSTHEYDAEQEGHYYWGHYFMSDELKAWMDYAKRSQELLEYIQRWNEVKSEEQDSQNQ